VWAISEGRKAAACVDAYLRTSATAVADTGFTAQKSQARAVQAAS